MLCLLCGMHGLELLEPSTHTRSVSTRNKSATAADSTQQKGHTAYAYDSPKAHRPRVH